MKRNLNKHLLWAAIALLGMTALSAADRPRTSGTERRRPAGTNAAQQNIVIEADGGVTYEANRAVWRNNVRVTDREMDLLCELLTVYFQTNGGRRIDTIIAETNVVIVERDNWAFGEKAVYTATNDVVTLSSTRGDVLLDAPDGYLMGPFIIFDRRTDRLHAPGNVIMGGTAQGGLFGTNTTGIGLPGSRSLTNAPRSSLPPQVPVGQP